MTPERWRLVEEIFDALLEVEPSDRAALLAARCGDDAALRAEVERLLALDDRAGGFLEAPAQPPPSLLGLSTPVHDPATAETRVATTDAEAGESVVPHVPNIIGSYRVERLIGHGGMGMVLQATRADDAYRKRVAIKLIRRGLDSPFLLQRFRSERQILAALDHPNIARLHDGGATPDGLPYLVMEFVEGRPIDRFCLERGLSIPDRLRLFQQVCSALQYAHQHLVVHRDIKPGNILVTPDGTPKLLDFGIAKLLEPGALAVTVDPTVPWQRLMTPQYASPEQVRGSQITTASDVYSLGVLLYELLAGRRPYEITASDDVARMICEEEPKRPSAVAEAGGPHATAAQVRRELAGDLDNIVLKAMAKEPSRRYRSAAQLSEDIQNYLDGRPVLAHGDTLFYRGAKFVRRHRAGVAAAGVVAVTLVGGTVATAWQAAIARSERAKAERRFNEVRELANAYLFDVYDAIENLPGSTEARRLVVTRSIACLDRLASEAEGDVSLQRDLGAAYQRIGDVLGRPLSSNLGNTAGALESYQKAAALFEQVAAATPDEIGVRADLAAIRVKIAAVLHSGGDTAGALENYRSAVALHEEVVAADPTVEARTNLAFATMKVADLLSASGDLPGTLDLRRRALDLLERVSAEEPENVKTKLTLGIAYQKLGNSLGNPDWPNAGDTSAALESLRKGLAIFGSVVSADPTNALAARYRAVAESNIATVHVGRGEVADALVACTRSLEAFQALSAADPADAQARFDVAIAYSQLGEVLEAKRDYASALRSYRRSLGLTEALAREDPANSGPREDIAYLYTQIGEQHAAMGDRAGAIRAFERARAQYETLVAQDGANAELQSELYGAYASLGRIHAEAGRGSDRLEEALLWLRKALGGYLEMRARGTMLNEDRDRPDELAREIAAYEARRAGE